MTPPDGRCGSVHGATAADAAQREHAKIAGTAGQLHFAWAGSTEPHRPHYYRIQGLRLLVEYDDSQRDANHVHTVWRDPAGDFGRDILAAHYASHHYLRPGFLAPSYACPACRRVSPGYVSAPVRALGARMASWNDPGGLLVDRRVRGRAVSGSQATGTSGRPLVNRSHPRGA